MYEGARKVSMRPNVAPVRRVPTVARLSGLIPVVLCGPAIGLMVGCQSDNSIKRVNQPPEVVIEAPGPDETFRQGLSLISLQGRVSDTYDHPEDLEVSWALDDAASFTAIVDPEGGVALEVDPVELSLGSHIARLTAIDSDGDSAFAEVAFTVGGPLGAPVVEITAPADGSSYLLGETITFTGLASDTTTPAEGLLFDWSSDLDGPLTGAITGGGESALITGDLTEGLHQIMLSVTDADGEVGQDLVMVEVKIENIDITPTPPEPGDLIFSEVMVNPSTAAAKDEDGEWVELYNTSGRVLDVQGYAFHDDGADSWTFDASLTVEPHGFLVLCANLDPTKNGGVACDGWFYRNPFGEQPTDGLGHGSGIAIANNDDELELTSPDGTDIDIFDYDDTDSDPIESDRSFGLDPGRMTGELNDNIDNWCVQVTILDGAVDAGTPGFDNDPCFE